MVEAGGVWTVQGVKRKQTLVVGGEALSYADSCFSGEGSAGDQRVRANGDGGGLQRV